MRLSPGQEFPVDVSAARGGHGGDNDDSDPIGDGMIVSVDPGGDVRIRAPREGAVNFYAPGPAGKESVLTKCWAVVVTPPGPGPVAVVMQAAATIEAAWESFNAKQCIDRWCPESVEGAVDGVPSVQRAPDNLIAACGGNTARALALSNQFGARLDLSELDDVAGEFSGGTGELIGNPNHPRWPTATIAFGKLWGGGPRNWWAAALSGDHGAMVRARSVGRVQQEPFVRRGYGRVGRLCSIFGAVRRRGSSRVLSPRVFARVPPGGATAVARMAAGAAGLDVYAG